MEKTPSGMGVTDPEENEKVFLQLVDFWAQRIVAKINEKIQERSKNKP